MRKAKVLKIAIVGLGAMGGILATHLAIAGEDVVAVDLDNQILTRAKEHGLKLVGPASAKTIGDTTSNHLRFVQTSVS